MAAIIEITRKTRAHLSSDMRRLLWCPYNERTEGRFPQAFDRDVLRREAEGCALKLPIGDQETTRL
jgi:hypothetical protein